MTTEDTPETTDAVEPASANREAAKYRKQLRDAESQLATVQERLTAARAEILRAALTGHQVDGKTFKVDALDDAGLDVETLFDESGKLNGDAVAQAMAGLAEARPYMFDAQPRLYIPGEGKIPRDQNTTPNWEDAFSPSNP